MDVYVAHHSLWSSDVEAKHQKKSDKTTSMAKQEKQ
jgi:hypothetical protein